MTGRKVLKVCSLHWGFIPGGVAAYARQIERLREYCPYRIKSICLTAPDWPFDRINAGQMDMMILPITGRLDLSWIPRLTRIISKERPSLIMTHGFNGAFAAAIASYGMKIPILSSWHGDYFPSTLIQQFRRPFFDIILKIVFQHIIKEIVTVSNFSKGTLLQKGIHSRKISVIHNGITPSTFNPDMKLQIRESLQVSDKTILVGTACRFVAPKGLPWLIRAIALAVRERPHLRLVIWGEGPLKRPLEKLAMELGISEFVLFPGYREDIDQCLHALDIFAMSSSAENFSIGLLEAMRAGLPIIATNVGGNPEAIHNLIDGILVPPSDPEALANGILALAGDAALRNRLGESARQRFLQEFTSDKMIRDTAQWLVSCAEKYQAIR